MNHRTRPCSNAKLMFPFILATTLAGWQTPLHADAYKWLDEHNGVHYSQEPPPPGISSTRIGAALPPADDPATITRELQQQLKVNDEKKEKAEDAASKQQQAIEDRKIRQQNCVTAHNNLEQLSKGGNVRYRTGSGEVMRLSEEERAKKIEEARGQVKEFCK